MKNKELSKDDLTTEIGINDHTRSDRDTQATKQKL